MSRGAALLAAAVAVVYAAGACPTIYVGDSGELVAAVHLLGIPHPSGYPLYVILGKLWTLLVPMGSVAFRMSLFSAAASAAACGVLYAVARRLGLHPVAAATAALLLAFSPSFWAEANVQRVYGLNALFVALATGAALAWHRSREARWLGATFGLCGLGACNHTFMAVYAVAFGAFAIATDPGLLRRPRALVLGAGAFGLGLLPYLYLLLRSRADPPLDWGNPDTLPRLLDVIVRRDFWGRAYFETPADLVPIAADYLWSLGAELLFAGTALAAVGVVVGRRRGAPVALPLLVMAGNLAAMAFHGSRSDLFIWHRYYVPSYVMLALLAGIGADALVPRLPGWLRALPLLLPAVLLVTGFRSYDRSRYRIADDFSRTLLGTLPPGAHLSASDDNILFVLIYLRWVEGLRPDLDLILEGVGGADLPPLRFDPDSDPLFLTHHPNWNVQGLEVVPVGLVFQTLRSGRPLPPPNLAKERLDGEDDPRVPKDYLTRNLIGHFHYMRGVSLEARDWLRAAREYEIAARGDHDNDVLFYNLGLIYARNGLVEESLAAFVRSNAINPRHIASRSRVRPADRVAQARQELERLRRVEARLAEGLPHAGMSEYHRLLADRLEAAGETLAARGHRLRALGPSAGLAP